MPDKLLVILDLDETLIHATDHPHDDQWHFELFGYKVYRRPHLTEFLDGLRNRFHVAVWSSASDDYVEKVVAEIFPEGYPLEFVWGRSRCTPRPDHEKAELMGFHGFSHYDYVKKLEKVFDKFPFRKERVVIVDDTPRKAMHNFGNAICPCEFTGRADDDELKHLLEYLCRLEHVENVRSVEKRGWKSSS